MTAGPFTREQLAAGEALFRRPWQFVKGVPRLDLLPPAERTEMCFAGRSNVGKSSLINGLAGRTLARTSRSEEHTSELQSLRHLVCRLLLEKKKKKKKS